MRKLLIYQGKCHVHQMKTWVSRKNLSLQAKESPLSISLKNHWLFNLLLGTDTQLKAAAPRLGLRAGQRQRWTASGAPA